jgi:hypothetical protein
MDELINQYFNLPTGLVIEEYASRLSLVCDTILDIDESSMQQRSEISKIADYLKQFSDAGIVNYERNDFVGELETHAFSTTLLLIREVDEKSESFESFALQCALIARMWLTRGPEDYNAFLQFYKTLIKIEKPLPFTKNFVARASVYELQVELKKVAKNRDDKALADLASFYQPAREREATKTGKSFYAAASFIKRSALLSENVAVEQVDAVDEFGEHIGIRLNVTPNLTKLSHQEYALYNKKKAGLQRALYNAEVAPAWSPKAATHPELMALLNSIDRNLLSGRISQIDAQTSMYLFFFLGKVFGLSDPFFFILVNKGSRNHREEQVKPGVISYALNKRAKREVNEASVTLNARLVDVAGPHHDAGRHHYYTNSQITLRLQEPLFSLLQNALAAIEPTQRNHKSVSHAFDLTPKDYSRWLARKIDEAGFKKFGLTRIAFEQTFLNSARERLPEATLNLMREQSSVQQHYVLQSHKEITKQINEAWSDFLLGLGFRRITRVDSASHSLHIDNAGSELTLRRRLLKAILQQTVEKAKLLLKDSALCSCVESFNELAFYIYLRAATTVGLRPVIEPFPSRSHFSARLKLMSVKDKAVHHEQERRLIVLTSQLSSLIEKHLEMADLLAEELAINNPSMVVSRLTPENQWEHFSSAFVEKKLSTLLSAPVKTHSLRHTAAQSFLKQSVNKRNYSQSAMNLFMNHARANAYALSTHSINSISEYSKCQQQLVEQADDAELDEVDAQALELLNKLNSGVRA